MKFNKIVIGIDDSTSVEETAEYGFEIARKFGAKVALVHVIMLVPVSPIAVPDLTGTSMQYDTTYDIETVKALEERSNVLMDEIIAKFGTGLTVSRYTETGAASETLLEKAIFLKADLVVIGTHNRGVFERFLMGSTTDSIVHHSPIPLLIVPAPANTK